MCYGEVFSILQITAPCKRKVSEASVLIPGITRFSTRTPLVFTSTCKFTSTSNVEICYKSFLKYKHELWSSAELEMKNRPCKIFLAGAVRWKLLNLLLVRRPMRQTSSCMCMYNSWRSPVLFDAAVCAGPRWEDSNQL